MEYKHQTALHLLEVILEEYELSLAVQLRINLLIGFNQYFGDEWERSYSILTKVQALA
ncbi:MAG: hypothetical protein V2I33_19870 [Kangiellaceae bacterium]|nr:hypothetical protein [Kangiellaceae bacterium]